MARSDRVLYLIIMGLILWTALNKIQSKFGSRVEIQTMGNRIMARNIDSGEEVVPGESEAGAGFLNAFQTAEVFKRPGPRSLNFVDEKCQNGSDCYKLQVQVLYEWNTERPRAAVYVVSNNPLALKAWIKNFDDAFNLNFKYPIVIFHESDLQPHIEDLRASTTSQLYFFEVEFQRPPQFKDITLEICPKHNEGYRHMCRFQSRFVFDQVILRNLDFYWRMDDDSRLLCPIEYDVFKHMQKNSYVLGYIWRIQEGPMCIEKLWDTVEEYVGGFNLSRGYLDDWPEGSSYYNNFEISALGFWQSEEYRRFIEYMDRTGGFYRYRWGDSPIHGLALALFADRSKVHRFADIAYKHYEYTTWGSKKCQDPLEI